MRPEPDPRVPEFLAALPVPVALPTMVVAEIEIGLDLVARGGRRDTRLRAFAEFRERCGPTVLPFDEQSALAMATMVGRRQRMGRPVARTDLMIAATALAHGAAVATRNVRDFEHTGVTVLDPWSPA